MNRKIPCKAQYDEIAILRDKLETQNLLIKKLELTNEELLLTNKKLVDKLSTTDISTINNHNTINNTFNLYLIPYNEQCIDPNIITPEYALTGIDGIVDLLEQSTLMSNGKRNLVCTDVSRNIFHRVNNDLQWVKDIDAKYIKKEIFPVLASLYKRASHKISEKLNKLVSDDVSLEEKRQELAMLICFMELSSDRLHQKIINKLKNKIHVDRKELSMTLL